MILIHDTNLPTLGALDEARRLKRSGRMERYDNPFERKWFLKDKDLHEYPDLAYLMKYLKSSIVLASYMLGGVVLLEDDTRHYDGVFIYEPGDYLNVHVDAGIHPDNGLRHHVTALMYLNGCVEGELEFWEGGSGWSDAAVITRLLATVVPARGRVVLFENNDYAWHGAAVAGSRRVVITTSFMSHDVGRFKNISQRAFFVPRPGEEDNPLRFKRVSNPEEVYRIDG